MSREKPDQLDPASQAASQAAEVAGNARGPEPRGGPRGGGRARVRPILERELTPAGQARALLVELEKRHVRVWAEHDGLHVSPSASRLPVALLERLGALAEPLREELAARARPARAESADLDPRPPLEAAPDLDPGPVLAAVPDLRLREALAERRDHRPGGRTPAQPRPRPQEDAMSAKTSNDIDAASREVDRAIQRRRDQATRPGRDDPGAPSEGGGTSGMAPKGGGGTTDAAPRGEGDR